MFTNVELKLNEIQGSVLGPALFSLFINDIVDCTKHCTIRLFADDTLLYTPVRSSSDICHLQEDLDRLSVWGHKNGMIFNATKSKIIIFGDSNRDPVDQPIYSLDNTPFTNCSTVKYLGLHLSNDMKWESHINYAIPKAMRILGLIKNTLHDAPVKIKLVAYTTLCRSLLEYGCEIWDPVSQTLTHKLEAVQNKAIRFIKNLKGREESVSGARSTLGLNTLKKARQARRINLFHKVFEHEELFPNLTNTLNDMTPTHSFNTRTTDKEHNLHSIVCNTNKFMQSFLLRTAQELRNGEIVAD